LGCGGSRDRGVIRQKVKKSVILQGHISAPTIWKGGKKYVRSAGENSCRETLGNSGKGIDRRLYGFVERLNSNFRFKLTQNVPSDDTYCEWVIEKKK